ncbi:ABC-type nitrate/sulfonate/bicarbonate transport system permease component [Bradyrhizobium barranii subsp. barranii]
MFFTVWLSTHIGVQKVDRGLIRAALMLGTPRRQMLQEIVLLGALPYIVVGLRTAVSISFYTLVAAELPVGRSKSPGYGHLKLPHLMIAVSAAEQQ